jgi:hypothetical protein
LPPSVVHHVSGGELHSIIIHHHTDHRFDTGILNSILAHHHFP